MRGTTGTKAKFWRGGASGRARLLGSAARRPEVAMPPKKPESDRASARRSAWSASLISIRLH
eukprot:3100298-Prymnesium_polylepis.1